MIEVGIVGGSGYGAVELIRLLQHHPNVTIKYIFSHSKVDEPIKDTFPHLTHLTHNYEALDTETVDCDVMFFATPSNVSKHVAPDLVKKNIKVIDLSGDFRLTNRDVYQQFYGEAAATQQQLNDANYSIAEWSEIDQTNTQLVANPGCFPTATLLALHPLIDQKLIQQDSIIIDAKTGVSGAGRSLAQHVHYAEMNENLSAYAIGKHKHKPEIEQYVSHLANEDIKVVFTPHLVPMTRGILSTIYVKLNKQTTSEDLHATFKQYYDSKPFVRIRDLGNYPKTKEVYGSNYCDIGMYVDEESQTAVIVSVIDNLVKGASGQAIQNFNLMYGLNEATGLTQLPVYP
ncbi:N-acetyl-gamma-glutamyl-phosphate reductase [Staphylococcus equorum]|uniref:N-acetyl-gamma-glutamyl-phosphate reductase n=2 Tax=Staphylococcus equorum TaxID=246432 RepID=UPI000D1C3559|nr:N-acetyl-gamma-glutamyl-phosphate reductase [Staphylococcus equorum]PTE44566.1 N-acetyl-gamma-glutamyl-phosphate reductase [Staphylococcus equorum]RIL47921.1 N-acetyl-gamma-glutamyl-phosphate reductase [Staphylococcus equorum]